MAASPPAYWTIFLESATLPLARGEGRSAPRTSGRNPNEPRKSFEINDPGPVTQWLRLAVGRRADRPPCRTCARARWRSCSAPVPKTGRSGPRGGRAARTPRQHWRRNWHRARSRKYLLFRYNGGPKRVDRLRRPPPITKGTVDAGMSSSEPHTLQRGFMIAGGKWSAFIFWAKHTSNLGRANYQRQYEPILYGWRYGHISTGAATAASRLYGTSTSARRPTCSRPYEARRSGRAGAPGAWTSCLSVCRFGLHPDGRAKAGRQAGLMEHDPKYCDVIVQRCSKGHFETRHCRSSRPMV